MFFKKKKGELQEYFDSLKSAKKLQNRLMKELSGLDMLDFEYHRKQKEINNKLGSTLRIRDHIEQKFIRRDGSMYAGTGYKIIEDLSGKEPELEPIFIKAQDKPGHFSIQGTTRVGKTKMMLNLIEQNLTARENVIVIDPKGGVKHEVLSFLVQKSYENDMLQYLQFYSLSYPELSDSLNPFFGMTHEERASLIKTIAAMGNSESFFSDVAYVITYAVSMAFEAIEIADDPFGKKVDELSKRELDRYKDWRKNCGFDRETIDANKRIYVPDQIDLSRLTPRSIKKEKLMYSSLMTFYDLAENSSYESLRKLKEHIEILTFPRELIEGHRNLFERFIEVKENSLLELNKILGKSEEFFSKISTSLDALMSQISQGPMGDLFSSIRINPLLLNLFDMTEESKQKRVVAIFQPFPLRFRKISDMSTIVFMLMLENIFGRIGASGRTFNKRLNIHIDEVRSVAYQSLERIPAQVGGIGGSLYFYTQSFADWVGGLGSESAAETMLDNLNTQIFFKMKDLNSAERVVKYLGRFKAIQSSVLVSQENGENRLSLAVEEVSVISPNDITKMKTGRFIMTTGTESFYGDTRYIENKKGSISMPKLSIEKRIEQLNYYDVNFEKINFPKNKDIKNEWN